MKKLIFIFCFFSFSTLAQQTILNVPSSSITPKGRHFFQGEVQFKTTNPNQFANFTNYYAYGFAHDLELDITQFNLQTPASNNVSVGIGFKKAFNLDEKNIYKPIVILGAMAPISLQGNRNGHWLYSAFNFTLPQTKTSFSAGISNGTKQIFGQEITCFMGGFVQEITEKLSFNGDWYSGNHTLGVAAFAFSYEILDDLIFYGGYQIANQNQRSNNSYIIEIATLF